MIKSLYRKFKLLDIPVQKFINRSNKPVNILENIHSKDGSFNSEEVIIQNEKNNKNNAYRLFSLDNGIINTDNCYSDCYLTSKMELINEITFSYSKKDSIHIHGSDNNIFNRYYSSPKIKKVKGNLFSFLSGGGPHVNYYHWLFDALPRLKILQKSNCLDKIDFYYVPNFSQQFKKDTLHYFGINDDQVIDSQKYTHISADNIIAATHPNPQPVEGWICDFLRESFIKKENDNFSNSKRIFISRRKATKRRISNEETLVKKLINYGFESILLEDLSFEQQKNYFLHADMILSPHGAGLANLVFCKKTARIIEIFPPDTHSDIYENISKNLDLNYLSIQGIKSESNSDKTDIHSDFSIDVDSILNMIENNQ